MKKNTILNTFLVIAIIVFLNLVSNYVYFRLDLTEDKRYTLGNATKEILKNIEEPVTIKAYFSENLPPQILKIRKDFEEYLVEYGRLSSGNVVYEFINPNKDEESEAQARSQGISPLMINVREKDQTKQQRAYLGAVLEMGSEKEIIPFMQSSIAMEYALTTAIKKMAVIEKPLIGWILGHGEPSLEDISQTKSNLEVLYNLQTIDLDNVKDISENFKTVAIARPTDSIPKTHLKKIDDYLQKGGNLLVAINRVEGDLENLTGNAVNTGLEEWLSSKGIEVEEAFLVDAQCSAVSVQQRQGFFSFRTQVEFPYLPNIKNFSNHPSTKGIESVMLQFASPISYTGENIEDFTALAFSSKKSNAEKLPVTFDVQKKWAESEFNNTPLTVAGVLTTTENSGINSNIYVFGDGDFFVNGTGNQAKQLPEDNVNFLVNAIDWMSDDTGLIDLRTKGVQSRPIDELEDGTRTFIKYLNFLLPIILLMIYGLIRMQLNKRKRNRLMNINYE
jgi:gliding-associated putative ABC transporter substrate-binding component GldG